MPDAVGGQCTTVPEVNGKMPLGIRCDQRFQAGICMKAGFFYSAAILIFFGAMYLVTKALNLLNKPSDSAVAGGILIILAVVILVPSAFSWAWHHHVTPQGGLLSQRISAQTAAPGI